MASSRFLLVSVLLGSALLFRPDVATASPAPVSAGLIDRAASTQAHDIAAWTIRTGDNHDLPFIIVDKRAARLFLFDRLGSLQAATPVLLGSAYGDVSPFGVGDKPLARITPAERITPAGRFVADKGVNLAGRDIVWVDYAAAIAIHRATDVKPGATTRERLRRLASTSPSDRRVSLGCINVSDSFYDAFLHPAFAGSSGIVYILPETGELHAISSGPTVAAR